MSFHKKLYSLSLSDLPGIGKGMLGRLNLHGVNSVAQLCSLSQSQCFGIWHSVVGKRWWHLLRGDDLQEFPTKRRTVSHSHVLHPGMRTDSGMHSVLTKLIHKAGARLRRLNYYAGRMSIQIANLWVASTSVPCYPNNKSLSCYLRLVFSYPLFRFDTIHSY